MKTKILANVDKHYDVKDFLDANKESSVVIRKRECSVKCGSLLYMMGIEVCPSILST